MVLIWARTKTYFVSFKEMGSNILLPPKKKHFKKWHFLFIRTQYSEYSPVPSHLCALNARIHKVLIPCFYRINKPVSFPLQRKENFLYLLPVILMLSTWTRTDRLWFLVEWPSCQPKSLSIGSSQPRKSPPMEQTLFMTWREALCICNLILTTRG